MNDYMNYSMCDFENKPLPNFIKHNNNIKDLYITTSRHSRLTVEICSDIIAKLDTAFKGVIPELAGDFFETN